METKKIITSLGLALIALQLGGEIGPIYGAPPIQSEEAAREEAKKQEEEKQKKTPEQEQKEKEEEELKATIRDIKKRQQKDEESIRVRANIFPSLPPEEECTAADRARARMEKVTGEGGLVILGDILIDSSNEADVENNEGSINNQVNVNIINESNKRC
jgi:hypothetical protein